MKDRLFEIWFSLCVGVASTEFRTILDRYGTPYDLFNADESELESLPVSLRLRQALADKSLQESGQIAEYCRKHDVGILFWQDDNYPSALRALRDPPVLLYYRGRLPDFNSRLCISVVGTRSMSEYGRRMAYKIGYELAAAGTVVVSGMALGNDSVAAAAAIAAGGNTVAVLGGGIDVIYPREHAGLCEEIVRTGAVMTEYPPGTPPMGYHFPVRNRIISGLSQGTLVVEGDLKSGALITARTAILQGRDIYALPGNIGETHAAGTNRLISEGAAVALCARDVLENYAFLYRDVLYMKRLSRAERNSDLDGEQLTRLGVYTRTVKSTAQAAPRKAAPRKAAPCKDAPRKDAPCTDAPRTDAPPEPSRRDAADCPAPAPQERRPAGTLPSAPKASPKPDGAAVGDASQRILDSLTNTQRRVFAAIPIEGTVTVEYLAREGFTISEIMAALTLLEIKGLIQTFPGSLICRR